MKEELDESEFVEEKGFELKEGQEGKAFLVSVYSGSSNKESCLEYLAELEGLATTFGIETVGKMAISLRKVDAATYIHEGKLEEIIQEMQRLNANCFIIDEEISPAQQRNLEKTLKVAVMDRTELILEIFAARAQTKEAQLQIELAKTKYQFPRLKRLWGHFSRQRASGGYLKGEGEKQIEIDRRLLKKKLHKLQEELKEVQRYRKTQKTARLRTSTPTFAIIGYTNAGKSTLINALTEAKVLVEDKLFATLDPTTRKFTLPNNQEILLTDTVGFIRKLPHTLVAAFRSTLEAALHDDVLLLLVDASHPLAQEHLEACYNLLKELEAQEESIIVVLNKIDLCEDRATIDRLQALHPKTVLLSAREKIGFEALFEKMVQELKERRVTVKLKIPQSHYALVALLRREGTILYEEYEGNEILLRAEVPLQHFYLFTPYQQEI